MIGEREPVVEALTKHQPGPDEDLQPIIHLAFYEGLLPKKGFDLILAATASATPSRPSAARNCRIRRK